MDIIKIIFSIINVTCLIMMILNYLKFKKILEMNEDKLMEKVENELKPIIRMISFWLIIFSVFYIIISIL
jgi:hypothetical protein